MSESDDFEAEVAPKLREEVLALHRGELGPRLALWSRNDPVTLFGAVYTAKGWPDVETAFQNLARSFTLSVSCDMEILASGASGDLGYVVAIERSVAATEGREPLSYALRVTTVFRREIGEWRVVHRHGDHLTESNQTPV